MARRTQLRNVAEYVPARALAAAIQCFPERANLATFRAAARVYAGLNARHRNRAIDNLRQSFPERSPAEVRRIAVASIEHLFQLAAVDAIMMGRRIRPDTWHRHIDVTPAAPAIDILASDQPSLLLTGHCGNWELLGYGLSVMGYPMAALARPLDNPLLNDWALGIRQAWGLEVLTKWGATPRMQEILEAGGRLGFIADQNAGDQGVFVPFFGRLASAYKSIALLAMRFETPIVVAMARRRSQAIDYEIVIGDIITPQDWAAQDDPLYYITARYTRGLESLVAACPEQYLWIHRRWKSRPKHVRRGVEMPASLARRIRSLPWLASAEADQLIETSNREAAADGL
ncbi:MAG: lysophospholipid acyltransferase family protein [Phycisphaerales bacterium]|jgi:KDO2-lipid IV(A) lauroyltransferase|nr:lysophospholipid acyltransferase family protein [Phycisphaerales bacterium]